MSDKKRGRACCGKTAQHLGGEPYRLMLFGKSVTRAGRSRSAWGFSPSAHELRRIKPPRAHASRLRSGDF
jgi:hypothetical protein